MSNATTLSLIPHMNKGTIVSENGIITQYRYLPGANDKQELNFKSITDEAEENSLLFYDSKSKDKKFLLRQYDDEEVPQDAKFMGHMTVVSNISSTYSGTLNPTHTYDV